jgi:predicted Zn-dependent protease
VKAKALLERAYAMGKATPPGGEAEEDWHVACRLLGDMQLEDGLPDQALACFADFTKSPKSGAATIYKMGQAYEQLGDAAKAAKRYENAAYYGGAVGEQAKAALRRLQPAAAPRG